MFDVSDPADLLALKTEVNTDPLGIGYDPLGGTADLLSLLNTKNVAYTVSKPKISASQVRALTTYDAYNNLSIDEQEWLRWITGSNGFDEENLVVTADLRTNFTDGANSIWAVADRTEMTAAMLGLIDVPGSRAEILFGFGTQISREDWFAARDS